MPSPTLGRSFSFRRTRLRDNCLLSSLDGLRLDGQNVLDDDEWRIYSAVKGDDRCNGDYYPTDGE